MADISDYLALVPSANSEKPNFIAFLSMAVQPFVDQINLALSVPVLMDIDSASGDQLDILGEWVNFSRRLNSPITGVYFSLGAAGPGLGQGIWFNSSEPATGIVNLDDNTYRDMLTLKVAANYWDGSMQQANQALVNVFGSQGDPPVIWIEDNFNMSEGVKITSASHSAVLDQIISGDYIPFKSAGVKRILA